LLSWCGWRKDNLDGWAGVALQQQDQRTGRQGEARQGKRYNSTVASPPSS